MAKLSSINKNNRRIKLAEKFYKKRKELKKIIMNKKLSLEERFKAQQKLSKLPRDSSKTREKLGWVPKYSLDQLIAEIINQDKKEAEKERILLNKGFIQNDPLETIPQIMGDI